MITKILICAGVTAAGAATGFFAGRKYVVRDKIIGDFLALCRYMRNDISFLQTPLEPLLKSYSDKVSPQTKALLDKYIECVKEGKGAKEAVDFAARKELKGEDKEQIAKLLDSLGRYDPEGQAAIIKGFETVLDELKKDAAEKKKKYASLYFKLGALAGAAAAILIL
jgi:stage III sporulation protein AB